MTTIPDSASARRYLLGDASDEECMRIEQQYFEGEDALDRIAAVEDDLIEDYLAGELSAGDRERFERVYLSAPRHRVRVETVRRLTALGSRSADADAGKARTASSGASMGYGPWLALAASLLLIASLGLWRFSPFSRRSSAVATNTIPQPQPAAQEQRAPAPRLRVFALTVSPLTVRGSSYSPNRVVPSGTDIIAVRLERDDDNRMLTARRATIATVSGREVWRGPVTADNNPLPGIVARLDVPAVNVPADDYVITLYGTDRKGTEVEWTQYVLRVRAQ